MKYLLILSISLLFVSKSYSQRFGYFSNVESFFEMNKNELDSTIRGNGYTLLKNDGKKNTKTYQNVSYDGKYNYSVTTVFKGNSLKSFLWDDDIVHGSFTVSDIGNNDYKVVEEKTNDKLGLFYLENWKRSLDVIIFKTEPNLRKGMIAFHLFKKENTEVEKSKTYPNVKPSEMQPFNTTKCKTLQSMSMFSKADVNSTKLCLLPKGVIVFVYMEWKGEYPGKFVRCSYYDKSGKLYNGYVLSSQLEWLEAG